MRLNEVTITMIVFTVFLAVASFGYLMELRLAEFYVRHASTESGYEYFWMLAQILETWFRILSLALLFSIIASTILVIKCLTQKYREKRGET